MSNVKVAWHKIIFNNRPIVRMINLGNGSQFKLISFLSKGELFVALERLGAFFFEPSRFKSGEYVSEKLNIPIADGNIIADWINAQMDLTDKQQGIYFLNYIKEENDTHMFYPHIATINPVVIDTHHQTIIPSNKLQEHGLPGSYYDDH